MNDEAVIYAGASPGEDRQDAERAVHDLRQYANEAGPGRRKEGYKYTHKVKYYECDKMGVTHHSNYVRFMEEARIDMLDRLGYGFERMEAEGVQSPVVGIKVDYKKPTTFQDVISIGVRIVELSNLKLRLGYEMKVGDAVVCTAESTHCFLEEGRPVIVSTRFPELAEALMNMKQ